MAQILDIPIFEDGFHSAVQTVLSACTNGTEGRNRLVSATSAHGLVFAKKETRFANTLRDFSLNLPDGMPLVWVGKLKGANNIQRCYGPDFIKAVLQVTAATSIKHFFCGGKEGVANDLAAVCKHRFQNDNCVGTFSPPFREMTEAEFVALGNMITESKADIVWIGLSTPKQEFFAKRLAEYVNVRFIITVGAAFDFLTGRIHQAPKWVQRSGFEWLFRLVSEPRRLFTRYVEVVPMFALYALKDIASESQRNNHKGVMNNGK